MLFESLGIKIYLIAPIFSSILYWYLGKPEFTFEDRDFTSSKWVSAIGLYFTLLLVLFGYFNTENYIGIVELFEKLQNGYEPFFTDDKILFWITFCVAIIFPIPTIFAFLTATIAHFSINYGVISFISFATVQYVLYLRVDSYFDMDDLLEWVKVLIPLIISVLKIIF